jgi:AGZA family xanthine/uracil permease-like MFS transporter
MEMASFFLVTTDDFLPRKRRLLFFMQAQASQSFLERFFKLSEKGTTVRTEVIAGFTTFIALAYIMFVNPNILADAGVPKEAAVASTIWIAALSTLMMGVFANYPVALAPGMGLNAFFAYYVCGVLGLHWTVALGAVFFSGLLFLILTISHVRQAIINAVPQNLRVAIGVGIGLFIAFVGLKGTGLIVSDPATFITLGSVLKPETAMSLFGLVLTGALMAREVQGAILIGIVATTILSMVLGYTPVPHAFADVISTSLPHMGETFGKLDIMGAWNYGILSIIFTFTVVELFDNMGTLIGLTAKAKLVKKDGEIENLDKALNTDAVGTIFSAIFGTSTVTSYIESAAGIAAGGKTGLTAVTVAVLFLVSLLFAPLIGLVPGYATAPPLILVGALMMSEVGKVNFADFTDGLPAFLTIIMMPLTSSIANGFAFGFISFAFMKTLASKPKEVSPIMWLVSIAFMINLFMRA